MSSLPTVAYATIYVFRAGSIVNWGNALKTVGALILMFGYIGVVLWLSEGYPSTVLFAAAGRMFLTLYILLSIYAIIIFYVFGGMGK